MNQLKLLTQRKLAPLFWTQFLGAFNDNLFKNAVALLFTYHIASSAESGQMLVALCQGLFILPFFLFSGIAGQLADRYEKSQLIQRVKLLEILIMGGAAYGSLTGNTHLLMGLVFCMGAQSAFFGPLKFGILPQHLSNAELTGGNGLVSMGTFLAILIGTLMGGVAVAMGTQGTIWLAVTLPVIAVLGWIASFAIPKATAADPTLKIDTNFIRPIWQLFGYARENRTIFLSILGISWFWFFGATLLTLFPNMNKVTLGTNEHVVTLFLMTFCVGIAIGSLLCNRLSGELVEIGLVPLGSIGMTLFTLHLYFMIDDRTIVPGTLMGVRAFLEGPGSCWILFDLLMLSLFGGLFIVPLQALIQHRADPERRARVIAANGLINALFMVASALMTMLLTKLGVGVTGILLMLGILTFVTTWYIYNLVPEFLLRFVAWFLMHSIYQLEVTGREHIPKTGGALLVANHITFVDGFIVAAASQRPVRFLVDHIHARRPIFRYFVKKGRAIPIAPRSEDPAILEAAYDRIAAELEAGHLVCIFPEGALTRDGRVRTFKRGIEKILARTAVPVIPMGLIGLWGSLFSRIVRKGPSRYIHKLFAPVRLIIDAPIDPKTTTAASLEAHVTALIST